VWPFSPRKLVNSVQTDDPPPVLIFLRVPFHGFSPSFDSPLSFKIPSILSDLLVVERFEFFFDLTSPQWHNFLTFLLVLFGPLFSPQLKRPPSPPRSEKIIPSGKRPSARRQDSYLMTPSQSPSQRPLSPPPFFSFFLKRIYPPLAVLALKMARKFNSAAPLKKDRDPFLALLPPPSMIRPASGGTGAFVLTQSRRMDDERFFSMEDGLKPGVVTPFPPRPFLPVFRQGLMFTEGLEGYFFSQTHVCAHTCRILPPPLLFPPTPITSGTFPKQRLSQLHCGRSWFF